MLPDSSVCFEQRMSGESVAGGSAIVVVSPVISQLEDQCSKIDSITRLTM